MTHRVPAVNRLIVVNDPATTHELWFPEKQIFEGNISTKSPQAPSVFTRVIGGIFNTWFVHQEKSILRHTLSNAYKIKEFGCSDATHVVMYLPGMFDYDSEESAENIFQAERCGRKESWLAINVLYSLRDTKRVVELISNLANLLEERIRAGKIVTIIGYSCGGIIGKVLADLLSTAYPGTCGLVIHNAPLDPMKGFFVRNANMAGFQDKIGFQRTHGGTYPLIVLNGSGDRIIPYSSCLHNGSGGEIKTKATPSTHKHPCTHPIAARRIRSAVRAVHMHIPKFPRNTDWCP